MQPARFHPMSNTNTTSAARDERQKFAVFTTNRNTGSFSHIGTFDTNEEAEAKAAANRGGNWHAWVEIAR